MKSPQSTPKSQSSDVLAESSYSARACSYADASYAVTPSNIEQAWETLEWCMIGIAWRAKSSPSWDQVRPRNIFILCHFFYQFRVLICNLIYTNLLK